MGCCASGRPQPIPGQQNPDPTQPKVGSNANPPVYQPPVTQPVNVQPQSNHVPSHPAKQVPSGISVGAHITQGIQNSHPANKSGFGGSNFNPIQSGNRSEIKGVQQIAGNHSRKGSEQKVSVPHYPSNIMPNNPYMASQLHNQNQPRLVELDHIKEFAQHNKANMGNSRVNEKVHGEEQVLQTYHQNFEIPIFEVALTAH